MLADTTIIGDRISTEKFSWDASRRTFCAEASDLRGFRHMGQVWNDAADAGFVMVSAATGREVVFTFSRTDTNDGDIAGWWFTSYPTPDIKCLVIND